MIRDLYLNDVGGLTLGVYMEEAPSIVSAGERGEWIEIAGRDGEAWRGDGALEGYDVEAKIYIVETASLSDVLEWLRGAARLRWGGWDWEYRVSGADIQIQVSEWKEFVELGWEGTVRWRAQPYRYRYPAAAAIAANNPGVLTNPGTAPSAPLITVEGSGDIALAIGGYTISMEGIEDGIVIDCESRTAYSLDGAQLLTGKLTLISTDAGRWPRLAPGANAIGWTGSATVSVLPRWRDR